MKEFALLMMVLATPLSLAAAMLQQRTPPRVDTGRSCRQAAADASCIREIP